MEDHEYPDDDPMENVQYQWSGGPSLAEQPQDIDMAIDPRLYGDAFVPWGPEPSQHAPGNVHVPSFLANHQPPFQEQFDLSEPSTTSENEGIWSEEEAK
jgi:hypothetical protein